jgi:hypothetical protein
VGLLVAEGMSIATELKISVVIPQLLLWDVKHVICKSLHRNHSNIGHSDVGHRL